MFFRSHKKSYDYYDEGGLLWNLYSASKYGKNLAGGGGGAGDKRFVHVTLVLLMSSGIRQVCDGKTAWKKNIEIVGSFNGLTTTCKLMTGIFFHNSEIIAVCHVYVTQ